MQSGDVLGFPFTEGPALNQRSVSLESQTLRALLEMRELMLRGEFRPGERLREVPLAARLNVSRTPLRLVLDRLAQEGLLKARPTGGFVANEFSVEDIRDAIEIRGVLEGAAARQAAERFKTTEEIARLRACVAALDALVRETPNDIEFFARYIDLNGQFHAMVVGLAKSAMLNRSMEHVLTLPFASPNAFFLTETETPEGKETILLSQAHHRAIANAIIDGEGARAESLAREHSRLARTNLETALKQQLLTRIPGASLIKFPEAI
jgi:GntR family transcriptional regulator, vanillate catabolism transcriptional regulator